MRNVSWFLPWRLVTPQLWTGQPRFDLARILDEYPLGESQTLQKTARYCAIIYLKAPSKLRSVERLATVTVDQMKKLAATTCRRRRQQESRCRELSCGIPAWLFDTIWFGSITRELEQMAGPCV